MFQVCMFTRVCVCVFPVGVLLKPPKMVALKKTQLHGRPFEETSRKGRWFPCESGKWSESADSSRHLEMVVKHYSAWLALVSENMD